MNLANKVILITGGARIGKAIAESMAADGARIAMTYHRSGATIKPFLQSLERKGTNTLALPADLTRETEVDAALKKTIARWGRLDGLIAMASTYQKTPLAQLTLSQWNKAISTNLTSTCLCAWKALPFLKKTRGRIVTIADWVAASGRPRYTGFAPYYSAKMGVIGFTQALALEVAPHVLVNAIAPGPIVPPKGIRNDEVKNIAAVTPLKKWGGSEEVVKAVRFLFETDFVTGECLRVDGGRHLF